MCVCIYTHTYMYIIYTHIYKYCRYIYIYMYVCVYIYIYIYVYITYIYTQRERESSAASSASRFLCVFFHECTAWKEQRKKKTTTAPQNVVLLWLRSEKQTAVANLRHYSRSPWTTPRAHHARCSTSHCLVPVDLFKKDELLWKSTFVWWNIWKCTNAKYFSFLPTVFEMLCWMDLFSPPPLLLVFTRSLHVAPPFCPTPLPRVGLRVFIAGTLGHIVEQHYSGGKRMCRKPCRIALYVLYIWNKDCILF